MLRGTDVSGGRPLRIVMVAHAFPPTLGGVETHLADLCHALRRRGHEVACLVGSDHDADEQYRSVAVLRRNAIAPERLLSAGDRAALESDIASVVGPLLRDRAPDIVHMHNAHHFGAELAAGVFAAATDVCLRRPALLNSIHDHVGEHVCPPVVDLSWDHVLYVSDFMRRALPTVRPFSTLRLGIDVDAFAAPLAAHPALAKLERPVIFHPARLLRWKGPEVGLAAFLTVRAALERGSLVLCRSEQIVGNPAETNALRGELRAMARRAGAEAHVHFHDFHHSDIAAAFWGSDLVWYPTLEDEPYGLVPLEAMAAGVPLIVTDSGGMAETVRAGVTALVVAKADSDELAREALRILRNDTLREQLVAAGRSHVREFDLAAFVRRVEALYYASVHVARGDLPDRR